MSTITIQTDNQTDLQIIISLAKRLNATVKQIKNPSPSNDPYFESIENLNELKYRIENSATISKRELTVEAQKDLLRL